jgi:hypothetical protein
MLVSFTHAEGNTVGHTSCKEGWAFLDAKLTRLSLFDSSGTRASVGCVVHWMLSAKREPCLPSDRWTVSPTVWLSRLFVRPCSFVPRFLSLFLISYSDLFLPAHYKSKRLLPQSMTHIHSAGLLWTRDRPVAETSTWQHTTLTRDRHPCPKEIRKHNPSKRAATDPRLKPKPTELTL